MWQKSTGLSILRKTASTTGSLTCAGWGSARSADPCSSSAVPGKRLRETQVGHGATPVCDVLCRTRETASEKDAPGGWLAVTN
jgi:hypothetical protein